MTPIQITDLRVRYEQHEFPAERPATESDLLSVLTDEALIGELVKRGVLTLDQTRFEYGQRYVSGWTTPAHTSTHTNYNTGEPCWCAAGEPVGSVGEKL